MSNFVCFQAVLHGRNGSFFFFLISDLLPKRSDALSKAGRKTTTTTSTLCVPLRPKLWPPPPPCDKSFLGNRRKSSFSVHPPLNSLRRSPIKLLICSKYSHRKKKRLGSIRLHPWDWLERSLPEPATEIIIIIKIISAKSQLKARLRVLVNRSKSIV